MFEKIDPTNNFKDCKQSETKYNKGTGPYVQHLNTNEVEVYVRESQNFSDLFNNIKGLINLKSYEKARMECFSYVVQETDNLCLQISTNDVSKVVSYDTIQEVAENIYQSTCNFISQEK